MEIGPRFFKRIAIIILICVLIIGAVFVIIRFLDRDRDDDVRDRNYQQALGIVYF